LQVICEASDGLEAVQKAHELRPDLIVLDIGLPTLNGIEVARRIRRLSPESKILFLSQESSVDVVREVLNLGARGYVVKAFAGSELLAAVEAVVQGNQFVSSGLSPFDLDAQDPDHPIYRTEALPSPAPKKEATTHCHEVAYYSNEAAFVVGFARFIEAALSVGRPVIVFVTTSHRQSLLQNLRSQGVDTTTSIEQGSLILLDVLEALSAFMVKGRVDGARFAKAAGDLIASAVKAAKGSHLRIAACGECAPALLTQDMADGAIELEHLWDEVAKTHDIEILCGYVPSALPCDHDMRVFRRIEEEHSSVVHSL
jgi:CheY-like chemotaxis protein